MAGQDKKFRRVRVSAERSFTNCNKAFRWISSGALIMLALVLYVPFLRQVFHFDPIGPADIALAFTVGVFGALWLEPLKVFFKKKS